MRISVFMALSVAAPILVATPVSAQTRGDADASASSVSHAFAYDDIDLATPHGAEILRRRASSAVEALCSNAIGPAVDGADYRFAMMKCQKQARAQIQPRVQSLLAAAPERKARMLAGNRSAAPAVAAR
jgi:UrcA family protein